MSHRRRLRKMLAVLAGWLAIGTYLLQEWARPLDEEDWP